MGGLPACGTGIDMTLRLGFTAAFDTCLSMPSPQPTLTAVPLVFFRPVRMATSPPGPPAVLPGLLLAVCLPIRLAGRMPVCMGLPTKPKANHATAVLMRQAFAHPNPRRSRHPCVSARPSWPKKSVKSAEDSPMATESSGRVARGGDWCERGPRHKRSPELPRYKRVRPGTSKRDQLSSGGVSPNAVLG